MCTTLLVYWRSRRRKEDSLDCDVNSSGYETLLFQFGKDIYVGVFYFYTFLLFLLGFIMKDCAVFVLWQSIWMWLGAEAEMVLSWYVRQEQWKMMTRAIVSSMPSLLLLSSSVFLFQLDFAYYTDDLGLWYGAPALDALCIGLVLPLFVPYLVAVHPKMYKGMSITFGLGLVDGR